MCIVNVFEDVGNLFTTGSNGGNRTLVQMYNYKCKIYSENVPLQTYEDFKISENQGVSVSFFKPFKVITILLKWVISYCHLFIQLRW